MADSVERDVREVLEAPEDDPIHPSMKKKETQDRVVQKLIQMRKKYADARAARIEPIWEQAYDIYHGIPPADNSPYQANFANREVFRQVESLKPLMASMLLPDDGDWFRYESKDSDTDEKPYLATQLVKSHLQRFGGAEAIMKWHDQSFVWGVSYLWYGWRRFKEIKRKISRLAGKGNVWGRKSEEFLHNAPYLEWVDHWRVYTDPFIEDPRESPACFITQRVTGAHLKSQIRAGLYDLNKTEKLIKDEGRAGGSMFDLKNNLQNAESVDDLFDMIEDDQTYEEDWCWTNDGWEYVIIDEEILLRGAENPYGSAPILTLRNYPQPGEHYGVGEPELLMGAHRQLHDATNLWLDAVHLTLSPVQIVNSSEANNWRKAKIKPGGNIIVDDMDGIKPMETSPHVFDLAGIRADLKNEMQLTSSLTSEVTGGGSEQKTATGIIRLQNAANARVEHKVRLYLPTFRELYQILYDLEAENMDQETLLRIVGPDGQRISRNVTPDAFGASVDVLIEVSPSIESRDQQMQKFVMLWQQISQDPRFNHEVIAKPMLRAHGIRNPDRAWASPMQTQVDVMKAIEQHKQTGYIEPAMPNDNHMIWMQALQMYMQTPEFMQMDPVSQAVLTARAQQHMTYLQQIQGVGAQGETAEQGPGEVVPGQEAQTNAETGSRMAGAAEQGAAPEMIARGNF